MLIFKFNCVCVCVCLCFYCSFHRYEIEYDENRLEIGHDIARRFLGIECENNPISDRQCGDEVVLQITDNDDLNKNTRRNSSSNDTTTATSTVPKQENTPNVSTANAINNTITTATTTTSTAAATATAADSAATTTATTLTTATVTITSITAASVAKPVSNTITTNTNATTIYSTTSANKLSKENVNATDATNEEVDSKSAHTTDNNRAISKDMHLNCEKGELVLDVLNDDLIEKVRGRISCKSSISHSYFMFNRILSFCNDVNLSIDVF